MNTTEFRKLVAQTKNIDWFKSVDFNLNFPTTNSQYNFKGFGNLYKFWYSQVRGWEKLGDNIPNEFVNIKRHFTTYQNRIIQFVQDNSEQENSNNLDNGFRSLKSPIENPNPALMTFDSPEVQFLLEVFRNERSSYQAAYEFLTGTLNQSYSRKENLNGYLLAYEFTNKDKSEIIARRDKEKSSLTRLKNEVEEYHSELENQLTEQLKNSKEKYEEYSTNLDEFKKEKEKSYSDWFINTKGEFEIFENESNQKVSDLENTYNTKLKLSEPAKYWSERGESLKKQGWIALSILVVLVLIVSWTLYELLWKTPEQIYSSFFEGDKSAAIRWSIIYITFI